jgi:hypothetical protein
MRDKRTAYHEAGHAEIAARFGLFVGEVTIDPEVPGVPGHYVGDYFEREADIRSPSRYRLAGPYVEAVYRGYQSEKIWGSSPTLAPYYRQER